MSLPSDEQSTTILRPHLPGLGAGRWTPVALLALGLVAVIGHAFQRPPASRPPPLHVELAGCHAFLKPRLCVLPPDRRLTLWLDGAPGAALELDAGGELQPLERVEVGGGTRLRVEIPAGAEELQARARRGGAEAVWTLSLQPFDEPPSIGRARQLLAQRRYAEARALLRRQLSGLPVDERRTALRLLAIACYGDGEPERGMQLMRFARAAYRRSGHVSGEVVAAGVLSMWLYGENRFAEARRTLSGLEGVREPADSSLYAAYYRGVLARLTGDLRSALHLFDDVARKAELVDVPLLRDLIPQNLLVSFRLTGQDEAADRLYAELSRRAAALRAELEQLAVGERAASHCALAALLNNLAWDRLLVLESGRPSEPPIPQLERALLAWRACGREGEVPNVKTNLALAHLHAGAVETARLELAQARELARAAGTAPLELQLWWLDLEARLALHDGKPQVAQRIYAEMADLAFLPEARWSATVGRARALEALGRLEDAAGAFAEAERLLDEEILLLPASDERQLFLRRRELATRAYLDLLLRLGREREALAVARRARSRVLRTLQRDERQAHLAPAEQARWDELIARYAALRRDLERDAEGEWRLPRERRRQSRARRAAKRQQLDRLLDDAYHILDHQPPAAGAPPLRKGEVILAFHPLTRGWVGFAADEQGVASHRFARLDESVARAELLAPFAARIARAARVRILPYGFLRALDLHALPFGDDVLLAAGPVTYGLDLPARTQPAPGGPLHRALLVVDPNGDLPAARAEARAVRRALEDAGLEVVVLAGLEAGGSGVRAHLAEADLLHFAGHGEAGGSGGWDSALVLSDGARLTAGDILTLPRAPTYVVLSGCDTARGASRAPAESITSLAFAFVAAGARGVVASPRPVGDRATAELMAAFYRRWQRGRSPAAALQQAELELRQRGEPGTDWASFRLLEP